MTDLSANQVDALAVSRVGTDIVLRWRVRQDNGREFRVWFTRADTGVTYALNAVPLSSSTRVMTLDSQALAAPCGDFHLTRLLADGTHTGPSLPVTLPVRPGGCDGGGEPPPPPPDGIHWVTRWRHLDHLGSLRLMTDESGWVVSGSQIDYYPFGMPMDAMPPSSWLFTGHEKDAATGLDYMLARMHSASVGSFTSVDPQGDVDEHMPISWNAYAYVLNQPLRAVDPDGQATYLVIYGQGEVAPGMSDGHQGRQFEIAARATAERIANGASFDPSADSVVVREVQNKEEFMESLVSSYDSGPIASVDVFSHANADVLNFGGSSGDRTFDRLDLKSLPRDALASASAVTLWGCNAGNPEDSDFLFPLAQAMANWFSVDVNAFTGPSEFVEQGRGIPPMRPSNSKDRMNTFHPQSANQGDEEADQDRSERRPATGIDHRSNGSGAMTLAVDEQNSTIAHGGWRSP